MENQYTGGYVRDGLGTRQERVERALEIATNSDLTGDAMDNLIQKD